MANMTFILVLLDKPFLIFHSFSSGPVVTKPHRTTESTRVDVWHGDIEAKCPL